MPHLRPRIQTQLLKKMGQLWPIVGVLGPRQSGKTTLLEHLLDIKNHVFLDDFRVRSRALDSPQTFIDALPTPVIMDEIQKAPPLFDALKHRIDRSRRPGLFYVTGSATFSSRIGIRESLTGRIGLLELTPLTLCELHAQPMRGKFQIIPKEKPRFTLGDFSQAMLLGGMPVPAFLRDPEQRALYWNTWLDTTLNRDLPAILKRGFDPGFALALIEKMASVLAEGELPTLTHFKQSARRVRNYLGAMEEIFLIRRIFPTENSIAKECWIFFDSGLTAYLLNQKITSGPHLSLIRHFLWNEWIAHSQASGKKITGYFYKSSRGPVIDAVFNGTPFKIVESEAGVSRRLSIEERPLRAAMKALDSKYGYLIGPIESFVSPAENDGVGILPWTSWS